MTTTGAVAGTESAIEVANGIDPTAAEIDSLAVRRLAIVEAPPLASTSVATGEMASNSWEKATLTGTIHQGNCGMTTPI